MTLSSLWRLDSVVSTRSKSWKSVILVCMLVLLLDDQVKLIELLLVHF